MIMVKAFKRTLAETVANLAMAVLIKVIQCDYLCTWNGV